LLNWVINFTDLLTLTSTDGTAKKVTISAIAKDGTVAELYRAGETLIKNAMEQEGNWHIFIEDFTMQADGSLAMTTGS
jgi:hypothetical protein